MTFWGFCFGLENSETRTQKRDKPTREEQKKRERIAKLLADAKPAEPQSTKRAEKQEILITKGEREEKRREEILDGMEKSIYRTKGGEGDIRKNKK